MAFAKYSVGISFENTDYNFLGFKITVVHWVKVGINVACFVCCTHLVGPVADLHGNRDVAEPSPVNFMQMPSSSAHTNKELLSLVDSIQGH